MSKSNRRLKPVTRTAELETKDILELLKTRRNDFVKTRSTDGIVDFLKDAISSFSFPPEKSSLFMEPFVDIHLYLVKTVKLIDAVPLMEELLIKTRTIKSPELDKFRSIIYAYHWNFMREHYRKLTFTQNITLVKIALGYSISHSLKNLSNLSLKLEQIFAIFPKVNDSGTGSKSVHEMTIEVGHTVMLLKDCVSSSIERDGCEPDLKFFDGYISFLFALLASLLHARETGEAKLCVTKLTSIYNGSKRNQTYMKTVELAANCFIDIMRRLFNPIELVATHEKMMSDLNTLMTDLNPTQKLRPGFTDYLQFQYIILRSLIRSLTIVLSNNRQLGADPSTFESIDFHHFHQIVSICLNLLKNENISNACPSHLEEGRYQLRWEAQTALLNLVIDQMGFGAGHSEMGECITGIVVHSTKNGSGGSFSSNSKHRQILRGFGVTLAQVCYLLHQKKEHAPAIKYGKICLSFYSDFENLSEDDKAIATGHLMVVGDAYFCLKKYEDGLRWLVYGLHKCPDLLLTQAQAFDSFTVLSVKDWHWSWLRMKTELDEESPCKEFTILEFSDRKFADPALVLRKELNCYFCGKQALVEDIVIVGEALEDNASHYTDKALGVLAQGIGFWWGNAEQENAATLLVRRALKVLEDGAETEKISSKVPNGVFSLVSSLATVWHGFCLLKNYQDRAVKDLEFASRLEKKEAPGKFEGAETVGRIIPAISTLTIHNEVQVADLFIEGINILYAIVQFEESEAKTWINHVGPAFVVVIVRLLAHRVAMLGDAYNSIRVWYIAFMLGKWYTLRRLVLLSGSELIKLVPNLSSSITKTVDDAYNYVTNVWPENNLAKSHILRVDLAKSIACLHKKEYEEGLRHLRVLFEYSATLSGGNKIIDAISHLIAESHFVLAQYKVLETSHGLKIDMGPGHTKLVAMSPAAIASKACKTLAGLARSSVIRLGGWQDLAHNLHVLQAVTEVYPPTLLVIKESGRMRDARVFIADFIYVSQQFCLISRSMQALVPLIEVELITKAFDAAQRKIECLLKLLDSYKKEVDEEEEDLPRTGSQNLYDHLASLGMNFTPEELKKINYEWQLPEANVPQRYSWSKQSDKLTYQWLPLQRITIPRYLSHSLDCACYLCRHPFIDALTVRFLQLQARYACYADRPVTSLSLLYCAKFFLVRAMVRATSQYFPLCCELQAVLTPETTMSVVALANTQWHFKTAFDWSTTLMEITPFEDIEMIIKQYNYLLEGIKIYDSVDKLLPMVPLEIMGAALFRYLSKINPNFARGSDFRENYRAIASSTPEVVTLDSDDDAGDAGRKVKEKRVKVKSPSPDFLLSTPPEQQVSKTPIVCLDAPKKRRGRPPKAKI